MVVALDNQGSCFIDEYAPENELTTPASVSCAKIAVALRATHATPRCWYKIVVDLEPDGTVVEIVNMVLAATPATSAMPEAPKGMIVEGRKGGVCFAQSFERGKPDYFTDELHDPVRSVQQFARETHFVPTCATTTDVRFEGEAEGTEADLANLNVSLSRDRLELKLNGHALVTDKTT
jgi:hypothetical protein